MKHDAERVSIKTATIDVEIIPFIRWLNEFSSVNTSWSCQDPPYVVFTTNSATNLAQILIALKGRAKCEVEWHRGTIRYCLRFKTKELLHSFMRTMK